MTQTAWIVIIVAVLLALGAGYYFGYDHGWEKAMPDSSNSAQDTKVGIANPASTNCVNLGGSLEIVDTAEGQVGYCHMSDGRVCEEWALFRDGACVAPK